MCKISKLFKKPKEKDQKPESRNEQQKLEEAAFRELHVTPGLSSAFSESEPLSRERYDGDRLHGGFGYGVTTSYEEYLLLFKKYKDITGKPEYSDDYYSIHYGG
jgi:hypothetical protein